MAHGRIAAIIFDLDGVLRFWNDSRTARIELAHGLKPGAIEAAAFESEILEKVVTGQITRATWVAQVGVNLGAARAVQEWAARGASVNHEVHQLLQELRKSGIRVALLTNGTDELAIELSDLGLDEEFDAIFNSAELHVAKPSEAVYRSILQSLGLNSTEVAYIDDSPANVYAASLCGIEVHLYDGVPVLKRWLAELAEKQRIPKGGRP